MRPNTLTHYLGMQLSSPIVVGSCPLTMQVDLVKQFAVAGAGAVVLPSLFEEQIVHRNNLQGYRVSDQESQVEWMRYREQEDAFNGGPLEYLNTIARLKHATGIPVIANLSGSTGGEWLRFATELEEFGVDAIEVWIEPGMAGEANDATAEEVLLESIELLCDQIHVPIAVRLSPFHSSLGNFAWRLTEAGASGVVCFAAEPLCQITPRGVAVGLEWPLSPAGHIHTTISGLLRLKKSGPAISIAASGGVSSTEDICKVVLAGANVAMVTSEIYRSGPEVIAHLVEGLSSYLARHDFPSFSDLLQASEVALRASRIRSDPDVSTFRSN